MGILGNAPQALVFSWGAAALVVGFFADGLFDAEVEGLAPAEALALGLALAEALGLPDVAPDAGGCAEAPEAVPAYGTSAAVWREVSGPATWSTPATTPTATRVPRIAKISRRFDFGARWSPPLSASFLSVVIYSAGLRPFRRFDAAVNGSRLVTNAGHASTGVAGKRFLPIRGLFIRLSLCRAPA
ncbi:hypothetical protein ACTI_47100 [Actinoplanes sp. OR16]|nr:hypothetical protein ACTI_47100 [Actinoplanes sp. OR16]